ncbi:hypothetical protein DUI87_09639 [Hirundo rustica rustica]|uniref:Uncharacterized protein n=1 Tax=Hirundo rustica rustica TaxID=333673 RepID=A0A3M0KMT6_HIRRU|nr:hypothetical protein DUI87_09639 [Hirundo rustica rustica]
MGVGRCGSRCLHVNVVGAAIDDSDLKGLVARNGAVNSVMLMKAVEVSLNVVKGETPPAELLQPWGQHREDVELLERVQRSPQSCSEGWSPSALEPGWESWGCSSGEGKAPGRAQSPLHGPKGAPGELERDWGQGMEGQDTENGFPLTEGRDGWDIGKELFPVRGVRPWHRVPREAVAAPGSLEVSKTRLDGAWISLGLWKVSLPMAE